VLQTAPVIRVQGLVSSGAFACILHRCGMDTRTNK